MAEQDNRGAQQTSVPHELFESIRKEAIQQVAKYALAAFVALVVIAGTGWWFYIRTVLPKLVGAVPTNAILAIDDPEGCTKLGSGWEDANFAGKILVGAGGGDPRWEYRKSGGSQSITIAGPNIPPLYLGYHTAQSGPGITLSMVEQLSFNKPTSANILQTSNVPAAPIDIMPPYVPIYFCKRTF